MSRRNLTFLSLALTLFSVALVHLGPALLNADILASPWLQGPLVSIDGWSLVHVYSLALAGVTFPGRFATFFALSSLFEVFEAWMAYGRADWHAVWEERGVNTAWDVFFNVFGYRLGERLLLGMYLQNMLSNVSPAMYDSLIAQSRVSGGDVDMLKLHAIVQTDVRLALHLPSPWWIGLVHMFVVGIPSFLVWQKDVSPLVCSLLGSLVLLIGWRMDVATRRTLRVN